MYFLILALTFIASRACDAGFHQVGNECVACPINTWSNKDSNECVPIDSCSLCSEHNPVGYVKEGLC